MTRDKNRVLLVGGLVAVAGGLLLLTPGARELEGRAMDWVQTLLKKAAAHEGYYWSQNPNLDGAGLSLGILQWNERAGTLGPLLAHLRAASPAVFDAAMGGTANALALLASTATAGVRPVNGANLWESPWRERFLTLLGPPTRAATLPEPATQMQKAMRDYATSDVYVASAVANARTLDAATERGMVFLHDRAIHQGTGGVRRLVANLVAFWAQRPESRPASVNDRLAQLGYLCADQFRRTTAPASGTAWRAVTEEYVPLAVADYRLTRRSVSGVWHLFAGQWDLYELITKRCSHVLLDPTLTDAPVALPPSQS